MDYIAKMNEIQISNTITTLMTTGYYQVNNTLHYYNALNFLFKFFDEK